MITPAERAEFVRTRSAALAKKPAQLCEQVIAKAMQGILDHAITMQERIDLLEDILRDHNIPVPPKG